MATIFLTVYGKEGIRELAEHNLAKAAYAAKMLAAQPGAKLLFTGAPRFHEFVLQTEEAPALWSKRLLEEKIVGGVELSRWYPELGNATLWCATEVITREQIDAAAQSAGGRAGGGVMTIDRRLMSQNPEWAAHDGQGSAAPDAERGAGL